MKKRITSSSQQACALLAYALQLALQQQLQLAYASLPYALLASSLLLLFSQLACASLQSS
jgi:hypothetical protein